MKKIHIILVVFAIVSLILPACSGARVSAAPITQVIQPSGAPGTVIPPGLDSGGYTQLIPAFASADVEANYKACIENALATTNPDRMITEITGHDETVELAEFKWCGTGQLGQDDVVFMSLYGVSRLIPGPTDQLVILGSATLWYLGEAVAVVALLATSYAIGSAAADYAYMHSDKAHSPNIDGSEARRIITAFLAAWTAHGTNGGQDPRSNCGEVRDAAGNLIKVAFAFYDQATGKFYTLWYWAKTGGTPWGGAHPKELTGKGSFENGPKDMASGFTWTTGTCGGSGNFIPGLQPAQPGR